VPGINRRFALRSLIAASAVVGLLAGGQPNVELTPKPAAYRPFTQPLAIPRRIVLGPHTTTIAARLARLPILPGERTPMWTFGGTFPGPTLILRSGRTARVRFVNDLPRQVGSITIHLHGGHHPARFDGQPDRYLISHGGAREYRYPTVFAGKPERGAFLWYHDHRMMVSGRNIWRGLAGMAILEDPRERRFGLPSGRYDVPLLLADRRFTKDGRAPYPSGANAQPPRDAATGDVILVNGVPQPYLDVAARRYRLRIVNASNFTAYRLRLSDGRPLVQIAGDQGLFPRPVRLPDLLLEPAQRAEIVVNFSGELGKRVMLRSTPRSQTELGTGTAAAPLLQLRVTHREPDHSRVPPKLLPLPSWVRRAPASPDRTWAFSMIAGGSGPTWAINGRPFDPNRVDARVKLGSVETWELMNTTTVTHIAHVHGFPFAVLSRNGNPPAPSESGLEDTVRLDPGDRVLIALRFADYTGRFMIHCHMLEHEDHGMMTTFEVVR
jgi:FtsP/CotA-like multicopper oxidase with cupredoxin domain